MKVSFLIPTFVLILADGISANRFEDSDSSPPPGSHKHVRKDRSPQKLNADKELNDNIVGGRSRKRPNRVPTIKDNLVETIEFNGMKTIEDLRLKGYEELDFIPYVCVGPNFNPDKKDTQCFHKKCHKGNDFTEKGSCTGNYECKIVSCVAKYAVKNNYLSFKNIPGLHHEDQIEDGHDPVTFAPWKCVPKEMNQPLIGGKDECDSYESCFDKKDDPMRSGNTCNTGFKCVLEENCPYVIMHQKFDNNLYGSSEMGDWPINTRHGIIGSGN